MSVGSQSTIASPEERNPHLILALTQVSEIPNNTTKQFDQVGFINGCFHRPGEVQKIRDYVREGLRFLQNFLSVIWIAFNSVSDVDIWA